MFCNTKKDSELRLIDFGSGTYDGAVADQSEDADVDRHDSSEAERYESSDSESGEV